MTFPPSRRLGINIYQQLICKNKEIWGYHLYCELFKNKLQPQIQALIEEEESKTLKSYSQTVTQIMNPVIASLETQNKALQALLLDLGRDPAFGSVFVCPSRRFSGFISSRNLQWCG